MSARKIQLLLVLAVILVGLIVLASASARLATAQDAASLKAKLGQLEAQGGSITFQFAAPFVAGETLWTLPDETGGRDLYEIGDDYLCFSEPWNNTRRIHCTPFTNVVSISYQES